MSANLPVYLDCAATTPLDPRVTEAMMQVLTDPGACGNAASAHGYGERAGALIDKARAQVADAVHCRPEEVVFTSGATEADNLAVMGVAEYYSQRGRHIITSRTEHKAVLDACRELQRRGWQVSWLTPAQGGRIEAAQVAEALRPDTTLVSIMHVNNETGALQDMAAIADVCDERGVPLHVDAAQSVGKAAVDLRNSRVALMSLSAHKAYGPKGIGALVLRGEGVHIKPQSHGGEQERALRSGTLATHQIVGMGAAFEIAAREWAEDAARIAALAQRLRSGLEAQGGVLRNGDPALCAPHIVNLSFEGVEGESLLAAVSPAIAVSTGSACTSASAEASYVLRALGRSERLAEASLRFGLGRFTTSADIDVALHAVTTALRRLRQVSGYDVSPLRAPTGALGAAS